MPDNYAVVVKARNEEALIELTLQKLITQSIKPSQIIVIDDGSTDKTHEMASKISGVLVLRNKKNLGKGSAIQMARKSILENSNLLKSKAVVILDADLQYDPKEMKKLTQTIIDEETDIVLGSRNGDIPYFRHLIANKIWTKSINLLFGYKDVNGELIKDICAMRAYSMETFMNVDKFDDPNWLTPKGYITEVYVLIEAIKRRLKIGQVHVRVNYNRKSSIHRGIRMFLGIEFYILKKGIPYLIKRIIK